MQAMKQADWAEATRRFEAAIDLDGRWSRRICIWATCGPSKATSPGAAAIWAAAIEVAPDRAYLSLDRLERAYTTLGTPSRFADLCRGLIRASPRDWRARVALARHLMSAGTQAASLELLFEALEHNPHALAIHQAIWNTLSLLDLPRPLVARYIDITRASVFYLDPHVCVRCRYRSTELLWQCPHCHEWNTFVEERITPATDSEAEIPAGLVQ